MINIPFFVNKLINQINFFLYAEVRFFLYSVYLNVRNCMLFDIMCFYLKLYKI